MNNVDLDLVKSLNSSRNIIKFITFIMTLGEFLYLYLKQKYWDIFIFVTLAVNNIPLKINPNLYISSHTSFHHHKENKRWNTYYALVGNSDSVKINKIKRNQIYLLGDASWSLVFYFCLDNKHKWKLLKTFLNAFKQIFI